MKYFFTFFWAVLLLEMVNFVLNSLNGGGPINFIAPLILAALMVLIVVLIDNAIKPDTYHPVKDTQK
ncbi:MULTISPECIES: YjzD family protein [Staphylococcus]|uniref:DUF2929 domain-containing protein n=1 Tax=Staphylococcus agnetis TaxID=985762 RepID=A0A2T4ML35_9STAP|nr:MULTISPECIES: YjzD family protein [Staphylococcus]ALN75958.1 YjzD family protein [Staphylococcus agnetis]MDG4943166.1 YjzD family protein [Staphylococcus agnetis]NHM92005.1 YjzD family protein [Staphylococcus sp. 10602379]NJI02908.1 DUF2929 family protein [Staphylococcus agnetis]NJI13529.1 DUF2929 family protein [Staphylococcus agnetis]